MTFKYLLVKGRPRGLPFTVYAAILIQGLKQRGRCQYSIIEKARRQSAGLIDLWNSKANSTGV